MSIANFELTWEDISKKHTDIAKKEQETGVLTVPADNEYLLHRENYLQTILVLKDKGIYICQLRDKSYNVSAIPNNGELPVVAVNVTPYRKLVHVNGVYTAVSVQNTLRGTLSAQRILDDRKSQAAEAGVIIADKGDLNIGSIPEADEEKTSGLTYGDALEHMKNRGSAMARKGWNGKGMFTYYVPPASYKAQTGIAKKFFGEDAMVPYNAYLAIKNVDGTVSTWVASINDQLAEDWYVVTLP